MFDLVLRPLKDSIFDPLCRLVPKSITPLHLTALAFAAGVASCMAAAMNSPLYAFIFWVANRILDCLDGAVARHRNEATDLGGFLDLLSDFIIYSAIPICCAIGQTGGESKATRSLWIGVAFAEASFHINNFVLFYVAALIEKRKAAATLDERNSKTTKAQDQHGVKELTSVAMVPALVEGAESGGLFTIMLAMPSLTESLCFILAGAVVIGIGQRVDLTVKALSKR